MRLALLPLLVASAASADDEPPTIESVAEQQAILEERIATLHEQQRTLLPLRRFITVFVDVGWFVAGGDGSGVRRDIGHRHVKDFDRVPAEWVLVGDPLSTAVNSNGEPADLGAARAIEDDTIDSNGNPTFIVNALGLDISRTLPHDFAVAALVELQPRSGPDRIVVEHAHVDYRPTNEVNLVLSAGKVESVLGIEYRAQDAPQRIGITPSLACRYTCGRPLGLRGHVEHAGFDISALLANGDTFEERFQEDPQLASAPAPTVAAHVQYVVPIANGIKVGASGAFGPQDGQSKLHVHQWHYGFDLRVRELRGIGVLAEFVHGKQQGSTMGTEPHCGVTQCLRYKAAYGMATYRATRRFVPYARVDWRDARHQRGVDFLYVSRLVRGTIGAQFAVTSRILGKVEYTYNRELLGPQFPNDVLTTSVVVSTD